MLGWIPFTLVDCPIDEVSNPRPEWLEAKKTGAQYIAHWIDDYNNGVCGKAKNFSSAMSFDRISIAIDNIDDEPKPNSWVSAAIPCRACYKIWKVKKNE